MTSRTFKKKKVLFIEAYSRSCSQYSKTTCNVL